MRRSCSKCGGIHKLEEECPRKRIYHRYEDQTERQQRSTYAWTKKSKDIRSRANYLCEVCRDKGIYTYEGLEVHHIEKLRGGTGDLLDERNLVCLCVEHHKQADANKISKDYLRKLAMRREGK